MPIWNYHYDFFHIVTIEKKIILGLHKKKSSCFHGKEILVVLKDMQQEI